ncbi:toxin-antitoxin system YwqK family antitoxin [Aliiglaciecola sp. M165]|uniref:toxin-antitoxin system YwqK family antitoxin n=1 Tax=Aliiglaciecola sp. M165 TaxID=2593649 RepID=UPI0011803F83|nr:toxin-antitoxin system YwqK family antitoxin [Aliiglaciecola sp. M165]TRY29961.1 toxin-antitoxin system YwqK family antitoxin [Aliiglaciecola sp. M165]
MSAILTSCLMALVPAFSFEKIVDTTQIDTNNRGERIYKGQLFTGEVWAYYPNGNLKSTEQFDRGRREGYSRKWFPDGVLAFESYHVAGTREGFVRSWWFNGNPRSETFYVKGKAEGTGWSWYRNGNKFKQFNFVNGQPSGLQKAWRENGKLFSNFEYKNGRIYGLRKANNCVGLEDEVISVGYYKKQSENLPFNTD